MPAAAVRRLGQMLLGFIGRKEYVGSELINILKYRFHFYVNFIKIIL